MTQLVKKQTQTYKKQIRTLFAKPDASTINLAGFDYLNLSSHPYVKEEAVQYAMQWGSGNLTGRSLPSYELALKKTESLLASFLGHETVTFYESSPGLFSKLTSLQEKPLLHSPSISKNRGEILSLEDLLQTKEQTNALLAVDDSLSFTTLGSHGFGLMAGKAGVDLLFGNFHKAFGPYASFIATSKELKSELFHKIPSLHKEQYLSPLLLGMVSATVKLLPSLNKERKKHSHLKKLLETLLRKNGYPFTESKAPFIAIPFTNTLDLKHLQLHLTDHLFITTTHDSSLILSPTIRLTEKEITNLHLTLSSYRELPRYEAL